MPIAALCEEPAFTDTEKAAAAVLVNVNLAWVATPGTAARTVKLPAVVLAISTGDVAMPLALVTAAIEPAASAPAPLAGSSKTTVMPATGFLFASVTSACSGLANSVFTCVFCPEPVETAMAAGTLVIVRLKEATPATPAADAVTLKLPGRWLAVKVGAVAMPTALVDTVADSLKTPDEPLGGAVKVTGTPASGLSQASVTRACNFVAKPRR